jgi:hypothetical protein
MVSTTSPNPWCWWSRNAGSPLRWSTAMPSAFSSAGTQRILQTSAPCSTQRFCRFRDWLLFIGTWLVMMMILLLFLHHSKILGLRVWGLGFNERTVLHDKKRFCHRYAAGVLKLEWSLTLWTSCTAQTTSSRRALPTPQCAGRRRQRV